MTAHRPIVSVIVPCFNMGRLLGDALESLRAQTLTAWECIVVDDGSTDGATAVAHQRERDSIARLVEMSHSGPSAARNAGLVHARGDYLHFLDADDLIDPDALRTLVEAATRAKADVVMSGHRETTLAGRLLREANAPTLRPDAFHALLRTNLAPCHAVLVRRDMVERVGGFDPALFGHEDWDLWLRLAGAGARFTTVPATLATYRRHPSSSTVPTSRRMMLATWMRVLDKAESTHPGCPICREQILSSRRLARRRDLAFLLDTLPSLTARQFTSELIQWTVDAVRADPAFLIHASLLLTRKVLGRGG